MKLQTQHLLMGIVFSILVHVGLIGVVLAWQVPAPATADHQSVMMTVAFSQAAPSTDIGQQQTEPSQALDQPQTPKTPPTPQEHQVIEPVVEAVTEPMLQINDPIVESQLDTDFESTPTPVKPIPIIPMHEVIQAHEQLIQQVQQLLPIQHDTPPAPVVEMSTVAPRALAQSTQVPVDSGNNVIAESNEQPQMSDASSQQGQSIADYRALVKQILQQHKTYPRKARRYGQEGNVPVTFVITADGQVENIQLGSSRAPVIFKRAVLALIKEAAPLPLPPDGTITLNLTFSYRLTD
jgi:protein TonB